jgi:hypothetical protein
MWGRIILRSADAPGGLESASALAAWFDEAGQDNVGLVAYEAILRRLAFNQGRLLITTTPYNLGWLKTEIFDRWEAGDPDIDVIQFDSRVNPAFPDAEYERLKRILPRWKFDMFHRGLFTRPVGLVYDCYDGKTVEHFTPPGRWPRIIGLDPGGAHTALVWLAHDQDNDKLHVYDVSLRGGLTTKGHCQRLRRQLAEERAGDWTVYGGAPSEEQIRRDWAAEGVPVLLPEVTGVQAQIDRVYAAFAEDRLVIHDNNKGLMDELARYRYAMDRTGTILDTIADKSLFHRLDALRYAVSGAAAPGTTFFLDEED